MIESKLIIVLVNICNLSRFFQGSVSFFIVSLVSNNNFEEISTSCNTKLRKDLFFKNLFSRAEKNSNNSLSTSLSFLLNRSLLRVLNQIAENYQ